VGSWIEWLTVAFVLPLPIAVWWLDRRRERLFFEALFAERQRSERLAGALQRLLAHETPESRGAALDALWTYRESELISER
jgi:uncharacterized protein YhjY with autotransporter beta-barrel domain